MDDGKGRFVMPGRDEEKNKQLIERRKKELGHLSNLFTVGEEIELKGSNFVLKDVSPKQHQAPTAPLTAGKD